MNAPTHPLHAATTPIDTARVYQITAMAFRLATTAVADDIRSECARVTLGGWTWWDTRPMLDPREHAAETIDMARLAIDYAVQTGLAMRNPMQPHLLHLLRASPAA